MTTFPLIWNASRWKNEIMLIPTKDVFMINQETDFIGSVTTKSKIIIFKEFYKHYAA